MRFKSAVIVSLIFHFTLVVLAFINPASKGRQGTTYYVDLIQLSAGGGGGAGSGGGGQPQSAKGKTTANVIEEEQKTVEPDPADVNLTEMTAKKSQPKSSLRYPDEKGKRRRENVRKDEMPVVKRKNVASKNPAKDKGETDSSVFKTGISAGGGSGSGTGTGGPGSGPGGFGSSSPYAYYYQRIRDMVSSSWYSSLVSPGLKGKYMTVVTFKIYRNGQITDLKYDSPSGINSLDLSALRAVRNATPFPPLPSDFPKPYLTVFFEFAWEK